MQDGCCSSASYKAARVQVLQTAQSLATPMSTQQQPREANKAGRFYNVKSGVNSFFTDEVLLQQIQQAAQLVIPLLVEGNLLANLHVLRCIEAEEAIPKLDQTFFNRCFYAVSFGTGNQAQQFNKASAPSLAATHDTLSELASKSPETREAHISKRREFCTIKSFLKFVRAILSRMLHKLTFTETTTCCRS